MGGPLACVVGDMDLVRPLGLAGIRCAVVADAGDPTRFSRHTAAAIDWIESWTAPEQLVDRLVAFGSRQRDAPILFYEWDSELLMVSRYRDRLARAFRFVVADAELVEDLVDKARFEALARRLPLPVPRGCRVDPAHGPPPVLDLRFPLVVKPVTRDRLDLWVPLSEWGKALRVESADELRRLWPRLASTGLEVVVQEEIEGPETEVESYHVYVDAEGAIAGEFTGRKIRTRPPAYGFTTALEITDAGDVYELGRELTRRLGLAGVAKFDFKRDARGELHLLEVNPRFNLWHHPGAKAGVNLPALVYADLTGRPRPPQRKARAGVRWCYHLHDARRAREGGMSPVAWLRWARSCEAVSALAVDDPMPFVRGFAWPQTRSRVGARVNRAARSLRGAPLATRRARRQSRTSGSREGGT